jgi:LacI family transcriptional regulator
VVTVHRRGNAAKKQNPAMPVKRRIPHVLLLVETSRAFGRGVIEGVARYAWENGPWSIQFEDRALDSLPPKWISEWKIDGIIARTTSMKQAGRLAKIRAPIVELHGTRSQKYQLVADYSRVAALVLDHFLNCGLYRFAYFSYEDNWWIKKNREYYCQTLKERGFQCDCYPAPATKDAVPVWRERHRPRLIRWLRGLPRPVGIFTSGDLHAVRLLNICREIDIAVPEEMAVLGNGNDPVICETVHPTLSSVDLNARRFGYEAARLLEMKMAGKEPRHIVSIPPHSVAVRQSTNLMAIENPDIVRAMRFIRENACIGVDVNSMAEELGLSRSFLERGFREHFGRSPKAEIMRVRIERAKMLLDRTDKTSQNLAKQCGFNSLEYFITAFRREVGMTPNAYRRMQRISRDFAAATT